MSDDANAYELSADEIAAGLTEDEAIALRHRRKGYSYRLIAGYIGPAVTRQQASRLVAAGKRKLERAYPGLRFGSL